jgi:hypothetical protein
VVRSSNDLLLALLATLSLLGCDRPAGPSAEGRPAPSISASAPAAAVTRATIAVDGAHDMMTKKDAPPYAIAPSSELVIEIGDHRFVARTDAGASEPDAVHVARGSTGYYRGSFKGKRAVLNAGSLDPVKGRDAFPGFEAGESYVVAIGAEAPSPDGTMRFVPAWSAKVNVGSK